MKKKLQNSAHAFILRITLSVALIAASAVLMISGLTVQSISRPPIDPTNTGVPVSAVAIRNVKPVVFRGDVRLLPQAPQPDVTRMELDEPKSNKAFLAMMMPPPAPEVATVPLAPMPTPTQSFPGMTRSDTCTGGPCGAGSPPDPNGAVGPNHYIEAVNSAFAIYNKTGTLLASFTENALWAGSGAPQCDGHGAGDPIVIYDALADRWILTNLAFTGTGTTGPFYECIAVSQTNDPVSGGYFLYAIQTDTGLSGQPPANTLNDYPKFGIWTDCLYYASNGFSSAGSFVGAEFGSFSRSDMYAGNTLTGALGFISTTTNPFSQVPSDLEAPVVGGYNGTPVGRPNYYVAESNTAFAFLVRRFTPGTNCGAGGTLSAATSVAQATYSGSGTGVPQPNTTNTLDTLFDRVMQKAQYRKLPNGTESLWVVHDSQASGATNRPQWAQISINTSTGVPNATVVQQQIYGPDTTLHRWMASLAVDIQGNMALGYSTSNGTSPNFPSLAYSGRLVSDTLSTLPQTETQLVAGSGSQTGTCGGAACTRWGDYSSMSIDPSDGCTFWYTNEYYTSQANGTNSPPIWSTRIGSFKFPTCSPTLVSVVSRFTHGAGAGTFDLPLSTSSRVVEPRTDFSGNYKIVFTFNEPVNSGSATTTDGSVGSVTFSGNSMIVALSGVTDQQTGTVTATNISGPGTGPLPSVSVQIGFLIGDVTGDGVINAGDTVVVRNNAGVTLDNTNFQNDVNTDGAVNVGDTQIVRANSGHFLP